MSFLGWGYSPEGIALQPYGQSIDSMPVVPGVSNGAIEAILPSVAGVPTIAYFEPQAVMQAPEKGPYDAGYLQFAIENRVTTTDTWFAPAQPVRYDTFQQLTSSTGNQIVHGSAPTQGLYTGVEDTCGNG